MLAHLYSLISNILQIFRPHQMPSPLHTSTSKIRASHQHSMKLGSKWAKVISVISHMMDIAHKMPTCRMRTAYRRKTVIPGNNLLPIRLMMNKYKSRINYLKHPSQEMRVCEYIHMRPDSLYSYV